MMMKHTLWIVTLLVFLLGTACQGQTYREKLEQKKAEEAKQKVAEKKAEPAKEEAKAQAPDLANICFGEGLKVAAKAMTVGGKKYTQEGNKLSLVDKDEDDEFTFGVLANIKTDLQPTFQGLDKMYAWFTQNKVDAVLVGGDTGEQYDDLKRILEFIGKKGLLTFVVVGNREKADDFDKAFGELSKTYPNLVNGNKIRHFAADDVDLLTLPGYYDANFMHNKPGCVYTEKELAKLAALRKTAGNALVLLGHASPKGAGKTSIDFAAEGGNVGDAKLTGFLKSNNVPFGVFSNIQEAGGKAVGADLQTVVAEGTLADKLYLNPGAADSDPWQMNDGKVSKGMAAVLKIKGGKASYNVFRVQ